MTSISWESSKKQRLSPVADYGKPPRLSYATREELSVYREEQTATKQPEFLSGNYLKKWTSNGSFEKDLNVSLLEKDFRNYSSFLEPETNTDEMQRLNTSEKTSLFALSRFPDFPSSSSSTHSTSTIVSSPAFSSSKDLFGGRLEPLIPDYFPGFFLGNEELLEKKPLEDSFQSHPFDSQDSPLEQPFATRHAESSPEKPPILSPISQFSPPLAEEKTQTCNIKKRSASSLVESSQIGDGISPIKIGFDSEDYCKVLEEASQASSIKDVYNKYKERLIQNFTRFEGKTLGYNAFNNHLNKWDKKKPTQISNGASLIKIDSEKFDKILEEAFQASNYLSVYNRYKESLIQSGYSWGYETFRVRVNTWKKINGISKQENIEIDEGSDPIGSSSEKFEEILALASRPKCCQRVFDKYKKKLVRDFPPNVGKPLLIDSFSTLLKKWEKNKNFLKEIRAAKNIRIGDGISPIRLNSEQFKELIEAASSNGMIKCIYDTHRERLIQTSGRHEGKPLGYDAFQRRVSNYLQNKKSEES